MKLSSWQNMFQGPKRRDAQIKGLLQLGEIQYILCKDTLDFHQKLKKFQTSALLHNLCCFIHFFIWYGNFRRYKIKLTACPFSRPGYRTFEFGVKFEHEVGLNLNALK